MRYFVENADYTGNEPILYDENALTEYALKVYDECRETGDYKCVNNYKKSELYYYETALKFLNDRFSNDDIPFKMAETYEHRDFDENIRCDVDTPFANCVIIHLSNGWHILKSYNKTIAKKHYGKQKVIIDLRYYNYSASTGKHRNYLLGETLKDTDKKIKNGEYQTADLN